MKASSRAYCNRFTALWKSYCPLPLLATEWIVTIGGMLGEDAYQARCLNKRSCVMGIITFYEEYSDLASYPGKVGGGRGVCVIDERD